MNNIMKKLLCGVCAAAMLLSLCGCAGENVPAAEAADTLSPAPTATPAPVSSGRHAGADTPDKEETVYVKADSAGAVREVTVETVLHYAGENGAVEDFTRLTDIKNTEGDEEFTLHRDGALTWEDHGEDITYEGRTDEQPPVTVSLRFWLDGTPIEPSELAGKSGRVRIRFDYENHTEQTVTVTHAKVEEDEDDAGEDEADEAPETEDVTVPIPFLAISLAALPEDTFADITVTNGRLLTLGEQSFALLYALPGLAETLALEDYEPAEEIDLPSWAEIEADVTEFSLDFTATLISNGLIKELEEEDLDDYEKLSDGIDKLTEASEKLVDGTRELADGAEDLADYLDEYADGVWKLCSGAAALRDGLSALSDSTPALREGVGAVTEGLAELKTAMAALELPEGMSVADTASALESVVAALDAFETDLAGLLAREAQLTGAISAADAALAKVDTSGLSAARDGVELTDEQRESIAAALEESAGSIQSSVEEARACLSAAPAALEGPALSACTETLVAAAAALKAKAEAALASVEELPPTPEGVVDQIAALTAGVTALCDAIDQIAPGSATLADGVRSLYDAGVELADGADELADGAGELADGMEEFDAEGVSELADLGGDELVSIITRLRAMRLTDADFDNFGGIADGRTGSVRFIIETDPVKQD